MYRRETSENEHARTAERRGRSLAMAKLTLGILVIITDTLTLNMTSFMS